MVKNILPIIGLLSMALAGACSKGPVVQETTLANGLKVIVGKDHRAPVVVSQIWYKVGAIDEPSGLTGISHVLEHMMFKGTRRLEPGEFSRIIAENGGRENAFTGRDYTAYFQQLEKSRLPISFELEADRMRNLQLNEQEFRKELQVVMEERRLRTEDQPQALAYEKFMATAYRVHPYKDPIIGWMDDLQGLTVKALQDWYQRWYAPNNATLVVVGDVEPKEVFALAEKYFGPLEPSSLNPAVLPAEPQQKALRGSRVSAPAELPYLIMGYHVPVLSGGGDDWEAYALSVLAGVLDGGNSARFASDLVRGQQVAAQTDVSYGATGRAPTLFMIDGTPAKGHGIDELEQAIQAQLKRLQKERISEAELKRVKAQVVAADVFGRDSVFSQAMRIGKLETVGLDHRMIDSYVRQVDEVTAAQVQAVARKYLVESNLTRTVLDPQPINQQEQRKPVEGGFDER